PFISGSPKSEVQGARGSAASELAINRARQTAAGTNGLGLLQGITGGHGVSFSGATSRDSYGESCLALQARRTWLSGKKDTCRYLSARSRGGLGSSSS